MNKHQNAKSRSTPLELMAFLLLSLLLLASACSQGGAPKTAPPETQPSVPEPLPQPTPISLNVLEARTTFLQQNPEAVMVDVRTTPEYHYVGHPVGALHIPWVVVPGKSIDAAFIEQLEQRDVDPSTFVLLLCRSGQRSMAAAKAMIDAGFNNPINISEGFEGPLDNNKHRGTSGGWRFHGLPWEQN